MRHSIGETGDPALAWLMIISNFRDDAPWLYEVGLDVYHALQRHDGPRIAKAIERLDRVLHTVRRGPLAEMLIDSSEMDMVVHELGRMAHYLLVSGESKSSPRGLAKSRAKNKSGDA